MFTLKPGFRSANIAALAVCLIASPIVARADGLPQLDFGNRLTIYQVVWGAVIFIVLYILASRTALPKVEAVLEERAKRIAGDLEGARVAKARADAGIKAAADATASARAEAQAAINAALESSKQAAALQSAALNERLERQLKEAESQIAAARSDALAALPGVATETAIALITRLTGVMPDPVRLNGAIHAAMAARFAPVPASLPSDHMMTQGWFLSRSTIRSARSRYASRQASSSLGLPRQPSKANPCVSRSHSSITHRPYSSQSSRKRRSGG